MKPFDEKSKTQLWYRKEDGSVEFRKENISSLWKIDWVTLFLVLVIVMLGLLYRQGIEECRAVAENPCKYCVVSGYSEFNVTAVLNDSFIGQEVVVDGVGSR